MKNDNDNMTDASSEMSSDSLATPQKTSSSRQRDWKDRVGSMSMSMVKQLCFDEKLPLLGFDSFGLLMRIHMITRLGHCLPEDLYLASKMLNTTRKRLEKSMDELKSTIPDLLILGDRGYTVPTLMGDHARPDPALSIKRREAALSKANGNKMSAKVNGARHHRRRNLESSFFFGDAESALQGALFSEGELPALSVSGKGKEAHPECPFDELAKMYNAIAKLPKVRDPSQWTAARRDNTRNRWRKHHTLEFWADVFARVERSDFLTGVTSKWRADFDWIIKPSNLQKIIEGNYENHGGGKRDLWGNGGGAPVSAESGMKSRVDAPFMQVKPTKAEEPVAPVALERPMGSSRIDAQAPFMRGVQRPASASSVTTPVVPAQAPSQPAAPKVRIAFRAAGEGK